MSKSKQTKAEKAAAAVDAHAIETQLAAQEPENIVPFPEVQEPGEQESQPEAVAYMESSQDVPDSEGHADPKECPSCGQTYDPLQVTVEECNRCQVPGATACCMPDGAGSLCTGCRAGEELPPVYQEPAELEEED